LPIAGQDSYPGAAGAAQGDTSAQHAGVSCADVPWASPAAPNPGPTHSEKLGAPAESAAAGLGMQAGMCNCTYTTMNADVEAAASSAASSQSVVAASPPGSPAAEGSTALQQGAFLQQSVWAAAGAPSVISSSSGDAGPELMPPLSRCHSWTSSVSWQEAGKEAAVALPGPQDASGSADRSTLAACSLQAIPGERW
jgi:hypothetical protein